MASKSSSDYGLEYSLPSEDLRDFVATFYSFRCDAPTYHENERADRAQIRFGLKGAGYYRFAGGRTERPSEVHVMGPTSGYVEAIGEGPLELFAFGLFPAGWAALMGGEASKWTDRCFDATAIFGDRLLDLRRRIMALPDLASRQKLAEKFVRALLKDIDAPPFWFTRSVDAWLIESLNPALSDLKERTGLSERQLERMTRRFYGMPPKLLARKYRALRAAAALARGEELGEEWVGDAFYDQSHLIREVKQFAGITPGRLASAPPPVLAMSIDKRNKLSGKASPLISDT